MQRQDQDAATCEQQRNRATGKDAEQQNQRSREESTDKLVRRTRAEGAEPVCGLQSRVAGHANAASQNMREPAEAVKRQQVRVVLQKTQTEDATNQRRSQIRSADDATAALAPSVMRMRSQIQPRGSPAAWANLWIIPRCECRERRAAQRSWPVPVRIRAGRGCSRHAHANSAQAAVEPRQ